jgi:hypothetical protein
MAGILSGYHSKERRAQFLCEENVRTGSEFVASDNQVQYCHSFNEVNKQEMYA